MAIVQIIRPETGKPVDVWHHEPGSAILADMFSRLVPCPHCGGEHRWTSGDEGLAVMALQDSPEASRVIVEGEDESRTATALYDPAVY